MSFLKKFLDGKIVLVDEPRMPDFGQLDRYDVEILKQELEEDERRNRNAK